MSAEQSLSVFASIEVTQSQPQGQEEQARVPTGTELDCNASASASSPATAGSCLSVSLSTTTTDRKTSSIPTQQRIFAQKRPFSDPPLSMTVSKSTPNEVHVVATPHENDPSSSSASSNHPTLSDEGVRSVAVQMILQQDKGSHSTKSSSNHTTQSHKSSVPKNSSIPSKTATTAHHHHVSACLPRNPSHIQIIRAGSPLQQGKCDLITTEEDDTDATASTCWSENTAHSEETGTIKMATKIAQCVCSKVVDYMTHQFRDTVQTLHQVMPHGNGGTTNYLQLVHYKSFLWETTVPVLGQQIITWFGRDNSVARMMMTTTSFANGTALTSMPPRRSRTTVIMADSGKNASSTTGSSNRNSSSLSSVATTLVVSLGLCGLSLGFTLFQYKAYKACWQWYRRHCRLPDASISA